MHSREMLLNSLHAARILIRKGLISDALDIYERLIELYPEISIDLLAEIYEYYQSLPNRDRYNLYQARLFDFALGPNDRILDIGSGNNPFPYATHHAEITLENDNYGRAGMPFKYVQGKPLIVCSIEKLPFQDQSFDFVYCSHVLEHVDDPATACEELMRVSRRGYIETPAPSKDFWLKTAEISNHKWKVEYKNDTLTFTEYATTELKGIGSDILSRMHCAPETKREKAFSALVYLKSAVLNTTLLWKNRFAYEVRRLSQDVNASASPGTPASLGFSVKSVNTCRSDSRAATTGTGRPVAPGNRGFTKGIPVVLICYNRPEHTRKVLASLRSHNIQNLFIFCDGPKNSSDNQSVRAVRSLINQIDWTRPNVVERPHNIGLAKSIISSVSHVLSQYDRIILLEDDCVPQKYFFDFMYKCLTRYEDYHEVYGISGYSIPIPDRVLSSYPYDIYFFPRIGSWGWATWKRAWEQLEPDLRLAYEKAVKDNIDLAQGGTDIPVILRDIFAGAAKDIWTLNWVLTVYLHKGYYIYPTMSHIENIGMDGTGVHCPSSTKFSTRYADRKPERFPDKVQLHREICLEFRKHYDIPQQTSCRSSIPRKQRRAVRIAHLCAHDFGGAGKAAYRLHTALRHRGLDSTLLVINKQSQDRSVKILPVDYSKYPVDCVDSPTFSSPLWAQQLSLWAKLLRRYPLKQPSLEIFTDAQSNVRLHILKEIESADIIHLHWVAGILDYKTAAIALQKKPVVWTLHDMNPFTGGCHYSARCEKYKTGCNACPQLGSTDKNDLARSIWLQKSSLYRQIDLTLVSPSAWLRNCVQQSQLLARYPIRVIANGISVDSFKPYAKSEAKRRIAVPESAFVVLFGADSVANERKGFQYLLQALASLSSLPRGADIFLAFFGHAPPEFSLPAGLPFRYLGVIQEEKDLAIVYSAADVFLIPSLEDNLPNTVMEAMACGTPVVGFDTGGISEMIEHQHTGYLAESGSVSGLVAGIDWAYRLGDQKTRVSEQCRQKAMSSYDHLAQADAYCSLYEDLLARRKLFSLEGKKDMYRQDNHSSCTVFDHSNNNSNTGKVTFDSYNSSFTAKKSLSAENNMKQQSGNSPLLSNTSACYLVSAIVSTYNSESFLPGCLEDLLAQTIA
ncbi:MAG: glycosyltransferase, partial [Deltaproteobacteria bacterium]|nr:glycosyltransferase [Deltaproteobacteria bacterium]